MKPIASTDECLRRDLLAWVFYPYNDNETICFPYPRYLIDEKGLIPINETVFPDVGNIAGLITAGNGAGDVKSRFGEVSVICLNTDEIQENPRTENKSKYLANVNMSMPTGRSELEFKQFGRHPLAKRLMQVIEVSDLVSLGGAPEGTTFQNKSRDVITEYALIVYHDANRDRLVGPISTRTKNREERIVSIAGVEKYDYRVYEFVGTPVDAIQTLRDQNQYPVFQFVEAGVIDRAISSKGFIQRHDWLPKNVLTDVMSKVIGLSDDMQEYSKNAKRRLKRGLQSLTDDAAGFVLDKERKERMLDLASDVEFFGKLPELIQDSVFERMTNEQLADIVLAPRNFPRFKDQVVNMPELQKEINEEIASHNASIEKIRAKETAARANMEAVQHELDEARESLAELQQRAAEEKTQELRDLEEKCVRRQEELEELQASVSELEESKDLLAEQIDKLGELLDDKVELSAEVVKSEVVKRIIALAGGTTMGEAKDGSQRRAPDTPAVILPHSTQDELVDRLFDVVAERSGRSYKRNDVINFYTCLTQGYITTFAGMPGTGKTSLCRLLAKGLGLNLPGSERFVEVSVERGWASFRDYVGYYNPLTRTEERSNQEVFEALSRLTDENEADPESVAPYMLLLDEANLSPIEHYWAPFLRACDSFDQQPTVLSIGGSRSLVLPRHTRFVATVNYDHTTEELSPRFLDRSWVIMLDSNEILDPEDMPTDDGPQTGMVSYADLANTFGRRQNVTMDASLEEAFTEALKVCAAHRHPVSPRSQNMMRGYMSAASELMENPVADRFDPVDYAIAQKVLPGISGPRELYEDLLDDLASVCSRLPHTQRIIEHMKSAGENSGYYQFFA